ncbi:MAG: hypothetical protein V4760_04715 [Bdellovibrionota bacterium]
MSNSIFKAALALALIAPSASFAQDASGGSQVGTSRVSGAATRSREDAGTSRTNLSTTAKASTRNLKFQFLNQAYAYQRDISEGERPVASNYTYVGATYKFAPSNYLALRVPFSYYVPKFEGESRFEMEDVYLNYWRADLATIPWKETSVSAALRLYFPTGEDSRFLDKRNGAARLTLMTSTEFAKRWSLDYLAYAQLNNHTQETYRLDDRTWANIDRTFVQGPTVSYDLNDKWSFSQLVGTTSNFAETGDRYGDNENFLNLVSSVFFQITPSLSSSLAFHNDVEIGDDLRPFRLGMNEDITYIFSIAATL